MFATHLILASVAIYLINFSGLISSVYIPLNPVTIGTVTLLGLPGVLLLFVVKLFVMNS
ncbi:pro-sigmaK processing inhibitor BofA family protein [Paenibacillus sp. CMAA1364]